MIDGVSVVWLAVANIDRALEFYADTLGLDIEQQEDHWALVVAGAVRIGLNEELPDGEGGAVIAFGCDDIEEAASELGVEIGEVSEHEWGRQASFRDPDGNELQLYESAE
jgi:predicted enzyme related to lactoylglutathione lyase